MVGKQKINSVHQLVASFQIWSHATKQSRKISLNLGEYGLRVPGLRPNPQGDLKKLPIAANELS